MGIAQIGLTPPPQGNGQCGPFFRLSKKTFKRVLQNQIPLENDDENDEYDYDDGNAAYYDALMSSMTIPKIFNYHDLTLWSK